MPSASHTVSAVGPELLTEIDHGEVVLERALADVGVGVAERAELVRHARSGGGRIVLERVRVHRVEADAELVGVRAQRGRVVRVVPRHVEADRVVGAGERVERGDVVELLLGGARLTATREPTEARPARAQCPRRSRHREAPHLGDHRLDVDPPVAEAVAERGQVAFVARHQVGLEVADPVGGDADGHRGSDQRRKAAVTPPSTGTRRPVVRDSAPPVSATTASATCSGRTARPSKVREA